MTVRAGRRVGRQRLLPNKVTDFPLDLILRARAPLYWDSEGGRISHWAPHSPIQGPESRAGPRLLHTYLALCDMGALISLS